MIGFEGPLSKKGLKSHTVWSEPGFLFGITCISDCDALRGIISFTTSNFSTQWVNSAALASCHLHHVHWASPEEVPVEGLGEFTVGAGLFTSLCSLGEWTDVLRTKGEFRVYCAFYVECSPLCIPWMYPCHLNGMLLSVSLKFLLKVCSSLRMFMAQR